METAAWHHQDPVGTCDEQAPQTFRASARGHRAVRVIADTLCSDASDAPATDEVEDEYDHRHNQYNVDKAVGEVEGEAAHPKDERDDGNGQEHARKLRPHILLASQIL